MFQAANYITRSSEVDNVVSLEMTCPSHVAEQINSDENDLNLKLSALSIGANFDLDLDSPLLEEYSQTFKLLEANSIEYIEVVCDEEGTLETGDYVPFTVHVYPQDFLDYVDYTIYWTFENFRGDRTIQNEKSDSYAWREIGQVNV